MKFLENLFGSKLKEEIESLNLKISTYENEIKELDSKSKSLIEQNFSLSSEVERFKLLEFSLSNEVLSLKSDLSKTKFLLEDLERKNKDLKNKMSSSSDTKTNELSKSYINELNSKNESLNKELNSTKEDLVFSKDKISSLENYIINVNAENKDLKIKILDLEDELRNKNHKIKELEKISSKGSLQEGTEEKLSDGFKGDLSDVNLFEFLQMMVLTKKEKLIIFTDLVTNKTGKIFLKSGEIIHSEFGTQEGLEAFLSIVGIKNGRFDVAKWVEPKEQTIDMPSMNLFMEAARIIDEKEAVIKSLEVDIGNEAVSEKDVIDKSKNILDSIDSSKKNLSGPDEAISKKIKESGDHKVEKIRIRKILVVDDSPTIISIMKKYLLSQGYDTVTEQSSTKALEILKKVDDFDLVITDIDMPELNGIELFMWIKEHKPRVQVIMMTAFGSDEVKEFADSVGALQYFEKPLNMKSVKKVLDEINQNTEGLKGTLDDINLFDFVQMIILSRKQKLISVSDPITKQTGKLYVSFGEIIHAECGDLKGEEAFYSIMAMKRGSFKDELWKDTDRTIKSKPMKLFMEASRRIEEETNKITQFEDNDKLLSSSSIEKSDISKELDSNSLVIKESYREVLGMILNKTTKEEANNLLKAYGCDSSLNPRLIICDSLSVILLFDESNILIEITFGSNYKGQTSKGIKTGDTIDKAVSIYGVPSLSSDKAVIWNNFAVFHQNNNIISSMRIR